MSDIDKLWFEMGVRDNVSKVLERVLDQAEQLGLEIDKLKPKFEKNLIVNAENLERVYDRIGVAIERINEARSKTKDKGELAQLKDMKKHLDSMVKMFQKFENSDKMVKLPGTAAFERLVQQFQLAMEQVSRYTNEIDKEAKIDERNKAAEAKRIDDLQAKYNELYRIRRQLQDAVINASPDSNTTEAAKDVNRLSAIIGAVKRAQASGGMMPKSADGADYAEYLRKIRERIQNLASATADYNTRLRDNESIRQSLNRIKLDTESQQTIARINQQSSAYMALQNKLEAVKLVMEEVKREETELANGSITKPTMTRDVVTQRLEAIQRKYNEDLAQGKMLERQDAEAKNARAAAAKRVSDAVQMLSHVNQGLVSSYNRIAEAGSNANRITIQFQQQLANYASLYGLERILKSVITIGGQFEVQHVALQNILGDVQEANVLFGQLQELAIESPKTFQELTAYAKQLSAYQIPTNELFDTTKRLADMSAGLGVDMNRLILAYGQVRSAAVLRGQELRQFTEAGIPMVQALADKFTELNGKVTTTADVFGLISKRAVPFEMVKEVLWDMTSQGGQFFNMQSELADTLYGKWQKLQDQWQITLGHIADGSNKTGQLLKWLLELTVSLASAFDTLSPMLGITGAAWGLFRVYNGINERIDKNNGNLAIKRMELAKLEQAASLERERVMYGRQLNAYEKQLVMTKNQLLSREYILLAQEGALSRKKVEQLINDGKINRFTLMRLAVEQGITKEIEKQKLLKMSNLDLANAVGVLPAAGKGWKQSLLGFFGGPTGAWMAGISAAIGVAMSAWSYFDQKSEELSLKGDSMMSHAQQGANSLAKTLNSMDAEGGIEKKIEVLEQALINLGSTGEAIVDNSRKHMDDIDERWKILKEGAEDYQRTLELMGNQTGKALFEEAIDNSSIENMLKSYDDAVNERLKQQSILKRYDETYRKAIESIAATDSEIADQIKDKNLFEQIDIIGLPRLEAKLNHLRESFRGTFEYGNGAIAQSLGPLREHFNLVSEADSKWQKISSESIPEMAAALKAMAENIGITSFDDLTPQQKQSLETLTREYVKAIQTGSVEAKDKLAEELASQVFHIQIQGHLTIDKTQLSSFANYIWNRFGGNSELNRLLGDKGNVRIGKSVYSKAQVANIFKDIDAYDKETSQAILNLQETKKKLQKLKGTESQVKEIEDQISEKLAERRAVGLDDPQKKGKGGSGSKKDEELNRWKARISLLEKYRQELQQLEEYMSRSNAERKLRKDNNFNALFGYFTNPNDYKASLDEAIKALGRKGDRGKFVDELGTKKGAEDLREFKEEVKNTVSELQRMMSVMSENYKTYQKWLDLTGDSALAARVAGVAENTSYSDWLTGRMNDELKKTNLALSASDVFGLSESQAKKLGEGNGLFKVWEEWQKNQQKIKKEQLDLYEDAIKNSKSYEDRIADINRKLRDELELIKKMDISQAEKDKLTQQRTDNANKDIAKERWKQFKDDNNWGEIFSDLDRMTTKSIDQMITKMQELLPTIEADETAVKDLYNALDKMRKEYSERNPLGTMFGSIQQSSRLRQLLNNVVSKRGSFTPNSVSAKYYGLEAGRTYSKEDIQRKIKDISSDFVEGLKGLTAGFKSVEDVLSPVVKLFDALGDTAISEGLNIGGEALGAANQVSSGLQSLGLEKLGPYGAAAAAGLSVVTSIFALHDKALQREIEASQARQKEMENLTENLQTVLERTLGGIYGATTGKDIISSLINEIRNPYQGWSDWKADMFDVDNTSEYRSYLKKETIDAVKNAEKTKKYYDATYASLLAQRDELVHQMESESDKKNSDADKLADYRQQIVEMEDQIKYFAQDMAKSLWDIDVKSWAKTLTETIVDAWKKGENAVDAYKNKVKEMMLDLTTNILSQRVMEEMLDKIGLDNLIADLMKNTKGELDMDAVAQIADRLSIAAEEGSELITSILDQMESKGYISKDDESTTSSTGGTSIKSISESTADIIAGYINAIRADVSVNRVTLAQILSAVQSSSEMPVIARAQLEQLQQIVANTNRNANAAELIYEILHRVAPDGTYIKIK